jgi:hypothetical protein
MAGSREEELENRIITLAGHINELTIQLESSLPNDELDEIEQHEVLQYVENARIAVEDATRDFTPKVTTSFLGRKGGG